MKIGFLKSVIEMGISALLLASCGQATSIKKPTAAKTTTTIAYVPVVNVIGQTTLAAAAELGQRKLRVSATSTSHCSNSFSSNEIIAETPNAGTLVQKGTVITLTTSSGSCAPPCTYVYMNGAGQVQCSQSPVLTDPNLLVQTLSTAAQTLMGSYAPQAQYNEFITQFRSRQTQQERDGALGLAWYSLDPTSEADAFIKANDQVAVMAANGAQWGDYLNCILGGSNVCNQSSSP
jgi:hypothetical protein